MMKKGMAIMLIAVFSVAAVVFGILYTTNSSAKDDEIEKLWWWIMKKYEYQKLSVSKIQSMIINFKNKKAA